MKFLLEENFPLTACSELQGRGHVAIRLIDANMLGAADSDVFALAQRENAILLTTDKDFFHTIPFLHDTHCGVVVVALRQPSRAAIVERLRWFLEHAPSSMQNRVLLLRDKTHVMR